MPYKGAGQAVNDLIAAHVPIACLGPTSLMPHLENKTLRFLAQSSETRSATLPDTPTFQEAGFKGMVLDQWFGVFVPAGTPKDVIARLNAEFGKSLADQKVRESMLKAANDPVGGTAGGVRQVFRQRYREIRAARQGARHQGGVGRVLRSLLRALPLRERAAQSFNEENRVRGLFARTF